MNPRRPLHGKSLSSLVDSTDLLDTVGGPTVQLDAFTSKTTSRSHLYFEEIPSWQQENEFVLSGYRPTTGSVAASYLSCLQWHNETININAHLLGCLLFAIVPWYFYQDSYLHYPFATATDLILFTLYLLGVSVCFACSASCHVLWNCSPSLAFFGNQLDYLGIILLMWTAGLPSIYYGFTCQTSIRNIYWSISTAMAGGCVYVTLHPRFRSPSFRTYRGVMYTGFGLSALLFVGHGVLLNGLEVQRKSMALDWMLLMAVLNLLGAAAYICRVPERLCPYTFDFVGASHQIFHIMVVFAGVAHYVGLTRAFHEARQARNPCDV